MEHLVELRDAAVVDRLAICVVAAATLHPGGLPPPAASSRRGRSRPSQTPTRPRTSRSSAAPSSSSPRPRPRPPPPTLPRTDREEEESIFACRQPCASPRHASAPTAVGHCAAARGEGNPEGCCAGRRAEGRRTCRQRALRGGGGDLRVETAGRVF